VIAHDGQSVVTFNHWPDDFKHVSDVRPSVNEVAEEDHLAFRMTVRSQGLLVAEEFKELHQFIGMAVNVADQVVHLSSSPHHVFLSPPASANR
jgi:hypothetical protein